MSLLIEDLLGRGLDPTLPLGHVQLRDKRPVAPDLGTQDRKSASQEGRESRMEPWHEADKITPGSFTRSLARGQ